MVLSKRIIKLSSCIRNPEEGSDGPQWESCVYYDRNYTYIEDTGMSYEDAQNTFPNLGGLNTKECSAWMYDTSIYKSTIVSDVMLH